MITLWFFITLFIWLISWSWATGIEKMNKNYPKYKGEDFLNWDEMKKYENDLYK